MRKIIFTVLLVLLVTLLACGASAAETHTDHCVCAGGYPDHACTDVSWQPLPEGTGDFGLLESGNYYLTADVTVTNNTRIAGGKNLTICLNGYDITSTTLRTFGITEESTLTVTDCTGKGTVYSGDSPHGQILYTNFDSVINIYGGNFTQQAGTHARNAGLFCIAQDVGSKTDPADRSVMNIYGGNIYGGKAGYGGNIYSMHCGQVNMYGGEVHDGVAQYIAWDNNGTKSYTPGMGGNVYVGSGASFNLYGGKVYDGIAAQSDTTVNNAGCGGNFATAGTLNIYGGEVFNGLAQHNPTTKSNGTAWSNKTTGRGGNVFITGTTAMLNMTGGKVYNGLANGLGGGNVMLESGSFLLSGGMIWGGVANADKDAKNSAALVNAYEVAGGSIRGTGRFIMTGGSVGINDQGQPAGGTCYPSGAECGNIYLLNENEHIISGGVIAYGNTWLENGKEVHGGISKGGNIGGYYIQIAGDAVIRDGYASTNGGNIALYNSTGITISGGTISGGKAARGGNIMIDGSNTSAHILHITGGTITGGTATKTGGNICINHASKGVSITGGTVTDGTAPEGGNFYIKGSLSFDRTTTITGSSSAEVMVMENNGFIAQYATVADAVAAFKPGQYLRLTGDVDAVTFTDGVITDLAGNNVTNAVLQGAPSFFDSATDGYNSTKAGTLTVKSGTPATYYQTADRVYLAALEQGSYTFQRYYMAINKITLKPSKVGVGYKVTFKCDETLKNQLDKNNAYGYQLWLSEDYKITRSFSAESFNGTKELTLRIDNFLDPKLDPAENEQRANMKVYACPYICLADGTIIEGITVSYSFRDMLEKATAYYDSYSKTQKSALNTLSAQFSASMLSWDIAGIHHAEGSVWQSVNTTSLVALLKLNNNRLPSGSYVLTEDVNVGSRSIYINEGATVNICLNGYTLNSSTRLFKTYGNLSLCDCHADGQEGYLKSDYGMDNDDTDSGEYAPIMYCYAPSVTNFYGGNIQPTKPVTFCGVLAVSHDNSNTSLPAAVFNMYGGTVYCNTVTGESGKDKAATGAGISVWNKATFNMYGGTVIGGNATNGGTIVVNSNCTMNMYGGTITGGNAIRGGNIYNSGILNISGGIIENGTATTGSGGNIYNAGTINMTGGTVTGGNATVRLDEFGDAVYTTGIGGGIFVNGSTFNCSGTAVIQGNTGSDLFIGTMSYVDIKDLQPGAKVGVYSFYDTVISQDASSAPYINTQQADKFIHTANGKVTISKVKPATYSPVSSFSVGYNKTNITTTQIGLIMSTWGNPNGRQTDGSVGYDLYATTVAITDEQNNTVLMITLDLQSIATANAEYMTQQISDATGVPADQIYISATHTHNCPSLNTSNARYFNQVVSALVQGAVSAMADRAPATMEVGSFDTVGMNFTRNYYYYLNNDTTTEPIYCGDQYGIPPQNGETRYRIREGDATMHLLSFSRSGKDPVMVVNWRAHPHRSGGMWKYSSDSDVIGATREYIEANTDYLFAYYQGASGNMNTVSSISGETYADRSASGIKKFGAELGRQIIEMGLPQLKEAETGLIQTTSLVYKGAINHDDDIYWENAQRLIDYHRSNPELMDTYLEQVTEANTILEDGTRKYEGVYSVYHAQQIVARHNSAETKDIPLNVFSIGNSVGFATSPAETWDRVSEELEELSPFETTFFLGYCDGSVGYIPYGVAGNYTSYEYYSCVFKQDDVIKEMIAYWLEQLNIQYENAK